MGKHGLLRTTIMQAKVVYYIYKLKFNLLDIHPLSIFYPSLTVKHLFQVFLSALSTSSSFIQKYNFVLNDVIYFNCKCHKQHFSIGISLNIIGGII